MDEADQADQITQLMIESARAANQKALSKSAAATGYCLNCDEPLEQFKRWCDYDCMVDWQSRNGH